MTAGELDIRRDVRAGDLGAVARLHGACYGPEYGLDETMERDVAGMMSEAVERGWPGEREGSWIAERGGRLAGYVALSDEGAGMGRVRWFIVDPAERGSGLGRRLLGELLKEAAGHGYRTLELTTFSELRAAARLYTQAGFRCVETVTERRWGRTLEVQRYELDVQSAAIRAAE